MPDTKRVAAVRGLMETTAHGILDARDARDRPDPGVVAHGREPLWRRSRQVSR